MRCIMRNIGEIKTQSDIQKVFNLAADGEPVVISNSTKANFVVLSQDVYAKLQNDLYLAKLDRSIQQVEAGQVVVKTIEELEAMEK